MALFSKVGSILKHSISQNSASSMLNSVRYMSTSLAVAGIPKAMGEIALKEAFSQFGRVKSARVILDPKTKMSNGSGFVVFDDDERAQLAMRAMDGQELEGRLVSVSISRKQPHSYVGGNGSGGGCGDGGGGRGDGGGGRGGGKSDFNSWRRKQYGTHEGGYDGGSYQPRVPGRGDYQGGDDSSGSGGYQRNSSYRGGNDEL